MAAPFLDNIAGTVTVAPGTGAITPTGAAAQASAWSTAPNGVYTYRAEGAAGWEIGLTLWNGATLTRAPITSSNANGLVNFSATDVIVALVEQADEIQPHMGGQHWGMWIAKASAATIDAIGLPAPTITGTASASTLSTASAGGRRQRMGITSLTTAGAIAGLSVSANGSGLYYSTDAADIGFEFVCRVGFGGIPTGPRFLIGMSAGSLSTVDPSTINNTLAIGKDVADTNFQLIRRSATAATKTDLGMAPVAGGIYEITIAKNPGNSDILATLINTDNSVAPVVTRIAAGSANLPVNNTQLFPVCQGSLGTATGTAVVMAFQHLFLRDAA